MESSSKSIAATTTTEAGRRISRSIPIANGGGGAKSQKQSVRSSKDAKIAVVSTNSSSPCSNSSSSIRPLKRASSSSTSSPVLTARNSLTKSSSVPANLRNADLSSSSSTTKNCNSILKRSSSFFFDGRSLRSLLRINRPAKVFVKNNPEINSSQKSVSFSADTSFNESTRTTSSNRINKKTTTTLHDTKIYRRGVLQGEFFFLICWKFTLSSVNILTNFNNSVIIRIFILFI